jgi:hypothetical protein
MTPSMAETARAEPVDEHSDDEGSFSKFAGLRSGISRRVFLGRGSLVAGLAAAVATVPGLGAVLTSPEVDDGPAVSAVSGATAEGGAAASEMTEPVVAHIVNAATGEINLYQGTQMIATRSPAIAQAIARLASPK